jgi:hypothetical protein
VVGRIVVVKEYLITTNAMVRSASIVIKRLYQYRDLSRGEMFSQRPKRISLSLVILLLFIFTLLLSTMSAQPSKAQSKEFYSQQLQEHLWPSNGQFKPLDEKQGSISEIEKAVLELGGSAVPMLSKALSDRDDLERRYYAAHYLALVGGNEARDILILDYQSTLDPMIKTALTLCMASTGTGKDIEFLIEALEGEVFNNDGDRISDPEVAALSLGVLRAKKALEPLRFRAANSDDQIAAATAAEVIVWLSDGHGAIQYDLNASEEDRLIFAVLECGIPRIKRLSAFVDRKKDRVFVSSTGHWRIVPFTEEYKASPQVSFDLYITRDGLRAISSVGMHFDKLDGAGYMYLFSKNNKRWEVRGILPVWVA